MREDKLKLSNSEVPITWVHTLIIGSGASSLNAAVQLKANGVDDVLIVSEGLDKGTSINTVSDKQTYYKLSLCGSETDAPEIMAETYFEGGSMHGDLALTEASLSARAFIHLVNLGVPFPRDAYGQFVGYKTDHDPRQRATSIGPYTSREMCRALIREIEKLDVPGRALDNIFIERLWRTVKYEDIYIREYDSLAALTRGLEGYFHFYNYERYHQSLDYAVPAAVHLPVKEQRLKTC